MEIRRQSAALNQKHGELSMCPRFQTVHGVHKQHCQLRANSSNMWSHGGYTSHSHQNRQCPFWWLNISFVPFPPAGATLDPAGSALVLSYKRGRGQQKPIQTGHTFSLSIRDPRTWCACFCKTMKAQRLSSLPCKLKAA